MSAPRWSRALPIAALWISSSAGGALSTADGAEEEPQAVLRALREDLRYANARWGVAVIEMPSGRLRLAHAERASFLTASSLKLVTTACALAALGPEFRFRTELHMRGAVRKGVLEGALVLRGGGDPSFGGALEREPGEALAAFADGVVAAGITELRGQVIGAADPAYESGLGDGWAWDYQHAWYAAPISGLCFRENVFTAVIEWPGTSARPRFSAEPPCSLLLCEDPVLVRAALEGEVSAIEFWRHPGSHRYRARGPLRRGSVPWRYDLAVEDPALYAAAALADLLASRGCSLRPPRASPPYAAGPAPGPSRALAVWHSPSLAALVKRTNTQSQNLYAEQLLREVGRSTGGNADIATARRVVDRLLIGWGIDPSECFLADGSGLSRENLFTPRAFVALLRAQLETPHAALYLSTLPAAGKEGTLAARLRDLPASIEVRAKTGSISQVKALCGYVLREGAVRRIFAILVNDTTRVDGDDVKRDIDRLVRAIAFQVAAGN